ncbi:hypothetical protein OC835_000767 [Tilletia horrida]|nr:hypothetical protein OC835_000767 [Tilletia horrida]
MPTKPLPPITTGSSESLLGADELPLARAGMLDGAETLQHQQPHPFPPQLPPPLAEASGSGSGSGSGNIKDGHHAGAPRSSMPKESRQPQSVADVVAASVGARRERKRKRIHYSCAECHRRKSKCDRKTPCQPCIDRGLGETCRPFEDGDEHGDARDRIQRLEEIVEGLAVAQASLAKELAALQHAQLETSGSLAKTKRELAAGGGGIGSELEQDLSAVDGSRRDSMPAAYEADSALMHGEGESSHHAYHRSSGSNLAAGANAAGLLSLSNRMLSPEDTRSDSGYSAFPRAPRSHNGSRHGHEYEHDERVAGGIEDGPARRRRYTGQDEDGAVSGSGDMSNLSDVGADPESLAGEGRIVTKVEATDNFEGGLTVEGGMHGEANWYGALALPSVSRSVVRTEIRGEHLELHADLPRCPASVMLYRLIHEGGAPPDILQQLMADLPPKETCDTLVRLYFRDINWTRLPIHEGTFRQSYDELMEFRSGRSPSESGETGGRHAPFLALLFVILATVKRSQPEDLGSEEDARTGSIKLLHGFKKTAAIAASIRIDHIDMLVAHLLAARWYIVNRHSGEAWAALGFAVRGAQAMGLHRDGSKLGLDAVTTERRRRLFSLVQYLDSTTAILLGRPVGINPAHCDSQPPSDIDIDTLPRASRPHAAIIYREGMPPGVWAFVAIRHEMNRLTGRIVEHFQNLEKARQYSDVMTIDQDLRNFRDRLPGPYRHTDADTSYDAICPWLPLHRYLLSIEIFYFRITLHRPYMLRSSDAKYDFSRRAAIESAKADRSLREEYRRTVDWPSSRCRRTFMGGLYRLFNATLIFAVALLQDPRGPDAADFASYLDEFIERHRSADRTDAATRREVKIIELFRAKALDPTWCALTATGAVSHPAKAMLGIHGPGSNARSANAAAVSPSLTASQRRSSSRPGVHVPSVVHTAAPLGGSGGGRVGSGPGQGSTSGPSAGASSSSAEHHRRSSSATGGIHFGDERSVIHAAPPAVPAPSAGSSGAAAAGPGAGLSWGPPASVSASAALGGGSGSGTSAGFALGGAVAAAAAAAAAAGAGPHRPAYVTANSDNGTNGILVPGTLAPHDSSPSAFPSLFGSAVGGPHARGSHSSAGGGGPGGGSGGSLWSGGAPGGGGGGSGGGSGGHSGSTPAPGAGGGTLASLVAPALFDFSGGLSLNSFGGGGGFGNAMGLGDAEFAQSLFDQLGVSLDQFGLPGVGSGGGGSVGGSGAGGSGGGLGSGSGGAGGYGEAGFLNGTGLG